jgi:hypothetical protein
MPFTPFHFGPGAFIKALLPKHFSFTLFVFTQVLIDCETLYFMVGGILPLHRFFHTYIGASLIVLIAVFVGRPVCQWCLAIVRLPQIISFRCAVITGFVGAYSHVLLDSIMHRDMSPFNPITQTNPTLHLINAGSLHGLCMLFGIMGVVVLFIGWVMGKLGIKFKK